MITASEFLKAKVPFRCKKITLPGGAGEMFVKEMTPAEIDNMHEEIERMRDDESDKYGPPGSFLRQRNCFARIIAMCVYDPKTQKPLFSNKQALQIAEKPMGYLIELKRLVEFACLGIGAEEIDDPNG